MKLPILIAVSLLTLATFCSAQSTPAPAATPAPNFDALHAAPPPPPSAPTVAQLQAIFHAKVVSQSQTTLRTLAAQYTTLSNLIASDDSEKGGLTPAQKLAALSPAELTELSTNAWLIANLLNGIKAGTVPNPPSN